MEVALMHPREVAIKSWLRLILLKVLHWVYYDRGCTFRPPECGEAEGRIARGGAGPLTKCLKRSAASCCCLRGPVLFAYLSVRKPKEALREEGRGTLTKRVKRSAASRCCCRGPVLFVHLSVGKPKEGSREEGRGPLTKRIKRSAASRCCCRGPVLSAHLSVGKPKEGSREEGRGTLTKRVKCSAASGCAGAPGQGQGQGQARRGTGGGRAGPPSYACSKIDLSVIYEAPDPFYIEAQHIAIHGYHLT
ncbi:hypothetical protein NDU88_004448 [Pleurodeles waltl]|uniref:Uncharacterized protein n=1 Tax=Pleurodeles waltl TaxID=8319 RepID=A0AAV7W7J4_PLEWA|nr:hypothetical protein NDU88_004448 [Pleurodeles waltl]